MPLVSFLCCLLPRQRIGGAFVAAMLVSAAVSPGSAQEGEAGEWTAGAYSFSDEMGGFTIESVTGRGTRDNPIVLTETLNSSSPVTLVIRSVWPIRPFDSAAFYDNGILYMRIVARNGSGHGWVEFEFELQELLHKASVFGDGLSFVAIAFAVLEIGGTATDIGLVFAAFSLPNVIFLLAGGVWADRLPRNLVMIASDAVRAVVQAGLAILLVTGQAQVWHVMLVAALHGTAAAFFVPASVGLIPQTLRPERLQQGNALLAISRSAAFVVGPALSGILIAGFGPAIVFAINTATGHVNAGLWFPFVITAIAATVTLLFWPETKDRDIHA